MTLKACSLAALLLYPAALLGQDSSLVRPYSAVDCPSCEGWNAPRQPSHLFGNTFYVGTGGLAALLITSSDGHILIDAGLPNSAPLILSNVRELGFDPAEIRIILNSHAHYDHAGG
ncbi:MAG: MBL fold metallo-hydrolase, partial [Gemmatimonadales bacterium]|nr:MBL fold metallo-hydrolase [Gemmatimonadales bacterium]